MKIPLLVAGCLLAAACGFAGSVAGLAVFGTSMTEQGPPGEQGTQGSAGPRGAVGPQGPTGQSGVRVYTLTDLFCGFESVSVVTNVEIAFGQLSVQKADICIDDDGF